MDTTYQAQSDKEIEQKQKRTQRIAEAHKLRAKTKNRREDNILQTKVGVLDREVRRGLDKFVTEKIEIRGALVQMAEDAEKFEGSAFNENHFQTELQKTRTTVKSKVGVAMPTNPYLKSPYHYHCHGDPTELLKKGEESGKKGPGGLSPFDETRRGRQSRVSCDWTECDINCPQLNGSCDIDRPVTRSMVRSKSVAPPPDASLFGDYRRRTSDDYHYNSYAVGLSPRGGMGHPLVLDARIQHFLKRDLPGETVGLYNL